MHDLTEAQIKVLHMLIEREYLGGPRVDSQTDGLIMTAAERRNLIERGFIKACPDDRVEAALPNAPYIGAALYRITEAGRRAIK